MNQDASPHSSIRRPGSRSLLGRSLAGLASCLGLTPLALLCCSSAPNMPGTVLGVYTVSGTIATNTCGATLGATTPLSFSVQLSKDGTTLWWNFQDGTPFASGVLDAKNHTTIAATISGSPDGSDAGAGPCTMSRTDTNDLTLSAEAVPASFTGTFTYAFAVVGGSDCSDQLTANGGTYQTLPCSVSYTMTAAKK